MPPKRVVCSFPERMVDLIQSEVAAMLTKSVAKYDDLRAFAGRLSWVATTVPRTRWTVTILFAVVADADREAR